MSGENNDEKFDFLSEIKKENVYEQLFPKKIAGLAIVCLHRNILDNTFIDGTFKEEDIHNALDEVNQKQENQDSRTQREYHTREYYNSIISELQEYFLRYDEEKRLYSFKEYAYEHCERAYKILKANFDPTKIEKICIELRKKLENSSEIKDIIDWFDIAFDSFKPHLKSQIDFLDRQIDTSVAELRLKTSIPEAMIIETLIAIDQQLEKIRKQNSELRAAFREIESIKSMLGKIAIKEDDVNIRNKVSDALSFFRDMNYNLKLVDSRLDRIQPKIKQLFSTLNRPLYNARIERFIRFLLEKSTIKTAENKKKLVFPLNIQPSVLHIPTPNFTIFERKNDLFPAHRKQRTEYIESPEKKEQAIKHSINKIALQDKVGEWMEFIEQELARNKIVFFAPIFFRILKEEPEGIDLAVNVTHRLIRDAYSKYPWKITITEHLERDNSINDITLWNMKITCQ